MTIDTQTIKQVATKVGVVLVRKASNSEVHRTGVAFGTALAATGRTVVSFVAAVRAA
jgi:hypothetical protein